MEKNNPLQQEQYMGHSYIDNGKSVLSKTHWMFEVLLTDILMKERTFG